MIKFKEYDEKLEKWWNEVQKLSSWFGRIDLTGVEILDSRLRSYDVQGAFDNDTPPAQFVKDLNELNAKPGDLVTCPRCEVRVCITATGECPSCRRVIIDTSGDYHMTKRSGGWYVVGHGMFEAVKDREEGEALIRELEGEDQ